MIAFIIVVIVVVVVACLGSLRAQPLSFLRRVEPHLTIDTNNDAINSTHRSLNENLLNKMLTRTVIDYASATELPYAADKNHMGGPQLAIRKVAVFLLGSMFNAVALGEPVPSGNSYIDCFSRAVASQATWARHAQYFFMVTGNGISEQNVLPRTEHCTNLTKIFHTMIPHGRQQVYECGPSRVMVLHFPHCNGNGWGPDGPCCRCQGAMTFFLDVHELHSSGREILHHSISHHSSPHKIDGQHTTTHQPHSGSQFSFAEWMTFSDDDYFIRLHALEGLLYSNLSRTAAYRPIALIPYSSGGTQVIPSVSRHSAEVRRDGYGLSLFDNNCTNRCVHRMPWMGFAGFSLGALKSLESSLRNGELVQACQNWQVTHDVGLGFYVWLKAPSMRLETIRVQQDSQTRITDNIIWHKPHRPYDQLFDQIWQWERAHHSANNEKLNWAASLPVDTVAPVEGNPTLNLTQFLEFEWAAGIRHLTLFPPSKMPGALSTLMHRREVVQGSLMNTVITRDPLPYEDEELEIFAKQHKSYARMINYSKANCREDSELFNQWLKDHETTMAELTTHDEPGLCLAYARYVANYPIATDYDEAMSFLPKKEDIERS